MCIARIENCLIEPGRDVEDCSQDDDVPGDIVSEELSQESSSSVGSGGKKDKEEEEDDFYYKNGEFFLDSLFMMSTMALVASFFIQDLATNFPWTSLFKLKLFCPLDH